MGPLVGRNSWSALIVKPEFSGEAAIIDAINEQNGGGEGEGVAN